MASNLTSASAQVRSLAKAVAAAFAASALTDEERMPGRIDIADLPWVAPPLQCDATLGGLRLSSYFDVPMPLEEHGLYAFWTTTLTDLWNKPSSVMRSGVFARCSRTMPRLKTGQRAFLFSTPVGFPSRIEPTAGAMFSLEVAHAAASSLPVTSVLSDENNYLVKTASGKVFGIRSGLPACGGPWDCSVAGMVPDLLTSSRGEADYRCQFDQIALVRSVLNVHRKRFPDFQALDYALQALRILTLGGHCPELVTAMRMLPLDIPRLQAEARALKDSLEIVHDLSMSDRSKLTIWRNRLVPDVISASAFRQHIYAGDQYPFSLAQAKLVKVQTYLEERYRSLPANMQEEGVCKL